jgi:hypothetical protein
VDLPEIKNKEEAVRFIARTLSNPIALLTPRFQIAIALSERFEVSVKDVLEYRKKQVRGA